MSKLYVPCDHNWEWKDYSCCQRKTCTKCNKILMGESRPLRKIETKPKIHKPDFSIKSYSPIIHKPRRLNFPEFNYGDARFVDLNVHGSMIRASVPEEAPADPCEIGSATDLFTHIEAADQRTLNDFTLGQSFTATAEPFYSIGVYRLNGTATGTITCRIGTSSDLSSSYVDSVSITVGSTEGAWYDGISSTCPTLTVATYYVVCSTATDLDLGIGINDTNPYAGGSYYYNGTGHLFTAPDNVAGRDLSIRIRVRR